MLTLVSFSIPIQCYFSISWPPPTLIYLLEILEIICVAHTFLLNSRNLSSTYTFDCLLSIHKWYVQNVTLLFSSNIKTFLIFSISPNDNIIHPVASAKNLAIHLGSLLCLLCISFVSGSLLFAPTTSILNQPSTFYLHEQYGGPSLPTELYLSIQTFSPQPGHHTAAK